MSLSLLFFPRAVRVYLLVACVGLLAACGVGVPVAQAQESTPLLFDPEVSLTQYIHDVWQLEDGLPQSIVNAVRQTRDGYLWLGTQDGLVRFDGASFKVYERSHHPGLENNIIRTLYEARDGALWIGTEGGLSRYRAGRFESFTTADGLPGDVIRSLFEDRAGHLWVGTLGTGFARFDGRRFTSFSPAAGQLPSETSGYVLSFAEAPDGTLWVGTADGLLLVQDGKVRTAAFQRRLPGTAVWSIHFEASGTAWIGTDGGLSRYEGGVLVPFPGQAALKGRRVSALASDGAGNLWIGTLNDGVCRLTAGRPECFGTGEGLTHQAVRSLALDHEGSLWIGTDGGGLNRLRPGKFIPLGTQEGLTDDFVLSVLEDRKGVLWAGTDGGGLNRIEHGRVRHYRTDHGLASEYIFALHEDRKARLWAGTRGGLCYLDGDRFRCYTQRDGLSNDEVYAVAEDRRGTLWIGTLLGLNRLSNGRITAFTADSVLAQTIITSIHEDRAGNLWVGTYGSGLFRLAGDRIYRYGTADGLTNGFILPITEDDDGTLWVGTLDGGLCRYDRGRFHCFTTEDGLYSDKILQVVDDGRGYLWLGSLGGIFQVSKHELKAQAAGRRQKVTSHLYGEVDGMPHREVNGGTQPSAWRGRDGRLWFATVKGLASIRPADVRRNPMPPPVRLEELLVNNQPVSLDDGLVLAPGSRDFTFSYTALSLAAPERVAFAYRLEPYDADWIEAGTRRQAYYTNLPPGTYHFRVKASNNDGIWNEEGVSFSFHVESFFYQTTWFLLLCLLAAGSLIITLYRFRVHHLRTRQAELTQLVDDRTRALRQRERLLEDLNANLECEVQRQIDVILAERHWYEGELIDAKEKAEESARLKMAILRNMSHEIRTPITAILGFAHVLSEEVEGAQQEFVSYISENGRRLLNTLNSILDLAKLETDQVVLTLEPLDLCHIVRESTHLLAPIARRREVVLRSQLPELPVLALADRNAIERILQNLVGNALKFTEEGEVVVAVEAHDAAVVLSVRDTGMGIGEDFLPHLFEEFKQESSGLNRSHEGSGLGLAITRRLVESLEGSIEVESTKHVGTTFRVFLPAACTAEEQSHEQMAEGPRHGHELGET